MMVFITDPPSARNASENTFAKVLVASSLFAMMVTLDGPCLRRAAATILLRSVSVAFTVKIVCWPGGCSVLTCGAPDTFISRMLASRVRGKTAIVTAVDHVPTMALTWLTSMSLCAARTP